MLPSQSTGNRSDPVPAFTPSLRAFLNSHLNQRIPVGSTATGIAICHSAGVWITQVRVGGRHTLAACSLPSPPSHSAPPSRLHPPSVPIRRRPTPADQDPPKLRNQNLGMVADTESSDSLAGSSNAAAEKPVDESLDKRSQEKGPKKTHKAEREKLKRDQLNDLFLELTSMLDLDRQNSGKATVLGDAARVLRDLVAQVESLRKEQSALLTESQYVSSEKNELQEENTALEAQILELQNELCARMGNNSLNLSSLGMSHPIGSNTPNLATHPMPHRIWSNGSNLSTLPMTHPTNSLSPLQNQHHHSADSGQVYALRPQELQLFPGTSASPERERSPHRSTPATSSSLTDSLPGQLRLSLPQTSQEESSSSALGSRKERKNG